MATSARSASRVVVRPSYPTSSTSSAQASSIRWTRATLLPCTGTRRSGPVVMVGVDTRRHSLSAVIMGTLLGSTTERHRRDAGHPVRWDSPLVGGTALAHTSILSRGKQRRGHPQRVTSPPRRAVYSAPAVAFAGAAFFAGAFFA